MDGISLDMACYIITTFFIYKTLLDNVQTVGVARGPMRGTPPN